MSAASFTSGFLDQSPMHTASGKTMGPSGQKSGRYGQKHARTFAERVADFLRQQHPNKTAQSVESETGVSASTVRKWLEQGNTPSGEAMLALSKRYGPDLLCAAYPEDREAWFFEAARRQRQARLERRAADLRRELAELREDCA